MKKILVLINGLGRGGAEQLLVNAAPYLDRTRFSYEIAYLLPWKNALVQELAEFDIPVHCLGGRRGLGWILRLRKLVKERNVDVVHAHSPVAAVGARLALGWRKPHRVYTEHNDWKRFHPLTRWANLITFSRNEHVFAVSDQVRGSISTAKVLQPLTRATVETLYHGPDPAKVRSWENGHGVRAELGIPDDALVVGTVANFKTHKGYRYLVDAARIVKQAVPNVRFVLVGLGPLENDIRRRAESYGLNGTMIFAGFREDAPRVAKQFDVFALASLHEGLSIALVEAMALGKPAVVTDVGGLPEVIEHGREGLIVPPRNPKALAVAIIGLLTNDALRSELGSAARLKAARFDIRNAVARMEQVYEELLS